MLKLTRSRLQRYSVAVLTVVVALLLTQLLWRLIKPTLTLYPLFFAAVMVSSWYGGLGPGLLATALAALACVYFLIPPLYSLAGSWSSMVGLIQFVLVALMISVLNTMLRSTQRRAEMNALLAQRSHERLLQTQESLHETEELYRFLVEGVTDYAILMLDLNGHIISWNTGAKRILGYQEVEIIGQHFERIFTPEQIGRGIPEQALRTAAAVGLSQDNRWHVRNDGTQFWANGVLTSLRDEVGNLRGFAKILQDLTERKRAEQERDQLLRREQAARAEAEAANRSKDEFLAILSHELRTPLTAILGWAGILHAGKLDEEKAALALETIERNANLQMQLIEDLLDISRIIRGDISLNVHLVELVPVITAAIEAVQPAADTKAIQLESVLDRKAGPLWGDSDRLQQVVWNLLSNAIKFTPVGGRVEVRLDRLDSLVHIQVSDTGKGISADFLPYVFDRFRQADSTSTRVHKGLGLGLAIARHLVELHGGTIQAESQGEGLGATFTVKLPLKAVRSLETSLASDEFQAHPTIGDRVPLDSPLRLNGLRVLVVDDEADARKFVSTVLEECGAEVTAVDSVDSALAAIEHFKPDVLVSDIGMPGEDGYALIRKVRELEADIGGRIPAVALTGYARVENHKEALLAGFQLHVAKPVRSAELIAVVASLAEWTEKL